MDTPRDEPPRVLAAAFPGLEPRALQGLLQSASILHLESDTLVLPRGQVAEAIWIVLAGELSAELPMHGGGTCPMASLEPGASVGGLGVVHGLSSPFDIRSAGKASLLRIPAATIRELVDDPVATFPDTLAAPGRRVPRIRSAFDQIFGALSDEELLELLFNCTIVELPRGGTLFSEGQQGDALFVPLQGRLEATAGANRRITLGEGEPIGERSLLTGEPRGATVAARRDSVLLRLEAAHFDALLEAHPQRMRVMLGLLARRVAVPTEPPRAAVMSNTLCIWPASKDPGLTTLARALTDALQPRGQVRLIDRSVVEAALGEGAADRGSHEAGSADVSFWLDQLERKGQTLVLLADPDHGPWTRRCLRHSEHLLRLARASDSPELHPGEAQTLAEGEHEACLVLLHSEDLPTGTAAWLALRAGCPWLHIREGSPEDVQRLARSLLGTEVSLAMGGGGARGFAHLGMVRGLRELGLPIDRVAGTSIGSGVGAGVALGLDLEVIKEAVLEIFRAGAPSRAWTIPFVSLFAPHVVEKPLKALARGLLIEDLWLPFFAVAANLSDGGTRIMDRGPAWRAIRASAALPAIMSPLPEGGQLLVDGGIVDNLPVLPLKQRSSGLVLALDVSSGAGPRVSTELQVLPEARSLLNSRLNPFARRLESPGIIEVVMQSMVCASQASCRLSSEAADLVVRPELGEFGLASFHAADRIEEAGYQAALARAEEVEALVAALQRAGSVGGGPRL